MSSIATLPAGVPSSQQPAPTRSTGDELMALGWEINANQHRVVHLAARFDEELEWYRLGLKSASQWIADRLQIQSSTAREWIRVGYALRYLPLTDAALAAQEISYAKVRIVTRWADDHNEAALLDLARERSANRLSVAIARFFADAGETDEERDLRLHNERSFSTSTDGDGMVVMRIVLPPSVAKPVVAAVDELVRRVAATPVTDAEEKQDASADATGQPSVAESPQLVVVSDETPVGDGLAATLHEMRRRWQPAEGGGWVVPSLAQQRADAFVALFLMVGVDLATEVVIHVRGDGVTFDDGTPTNESAVLRQLEDAFIRLLIHDAERRPVNASSRRRHPTARQKRVAMETHGHECVDCQSTDLLEFDHNPPYEQTGHTVTDELEPRCGPCHRARHRADVAPDGRSVAPGELPHPTAGVHRSVRSSA